MLLEIQNPTVLSKAIDILSELVTEVRMKINDQGLSISAMDPANAAMVGFKIPKSSFSKLETGNETLGINLDNLKQVLKRCGVGSSLKIERKENMLELSISDKIKRNFNISLINIESDEIDFEAKISRMEFASKVELESSDFTACIEDCKIMADSCVFEIKNKQFVIEAKGLNSTRSEFSGDEAKIEGEEARSKYSLGYLEKFIKGAKIADKVILEFADEHPLKVEYKNPLLEIKFVLAPMGEVED